jgi:hypothetical protein
MAHSQEPGTGESGIQQTSCTNCGGGLLGRPEFPGDGVASCGEGCIPGRQKCGCCCTSDNAVARLFCGIYDCICCPDPCYEPHWIAAADAAFFQDSARPVTQMRFRWDTGWDLLRPDRAEYFWARERGPLGPNVIARAVNYREFSLYTEGAIDRIGIFVDTPYREVGIKAAAISPTPDHTFSGFSDVVVGTKTLLLDCELTQVAFQFKTFIPSGSSMKGLGTGHVSLEPALLFALRLTPLTYLQAETAYWIPIGGDSLYQGNVFHGHLSLNQVLWHINHNVQVIGTLEGNEWSVINGNYTNSDTLDAGGHPIAVRARASMFSAGPGIRFVVCDKIDLGVGSAFSLTGDHWAEELVRAEFRWRF